MKCCSTCKLSKPLDSFHVRRDSGDGRASSCKECVRKRSRNWKCANPERVRELRRLRRAANCENERAKAKQYRDANREKVRAQSRRWRNANAEYYREVHLKRKFNLSIEEYNHILEKQGNVCAICRLTSNSRFRVDHDHRTGVVRGLLCGKCNTGLGLLKDDPGVLTSAINYIQSDGTRKAWLTPPTLYFGAYS